LRQLKKDGTRGHALLIWEVRARKSTKLFTVQDGRTK
jgi:hypothetical protein